MYEALDHPNILSAIFHPRPEINPSPPGDNATDHLIAVDPGVHVGARFHMVAPLGANLLFFHGNGEIVSDYDDLGPLYNRMGINLMVADYRGYGRSNGTPTVSGMMSDGHKILAYALDWLENNRHTGPLILMGRSLGSASALELVSRHPDRVAGLIIESGFAYAAPLLRLLGVNPTEIDFTEETAFANLTKIGRCHVPTLIIHAEFDHIIPFSDGKALFKASPAEDKQLLKINGANHNDIFMRGLNPYLQSIGNLIARISPPDASSGPHGQSTGDANRE